jgi:hypothetical protein
MSDGPRLAVIPAAALADVASGALKAMDLRVLCALGTFTNRHGWARVYVDTLAERVGPTTARETVSRSLSRLKKRGWVEARAPKRGGSHAYAWRVNLNPDVDPDFEDEISGSGDGEGATSGVEDGASRDETVTGCCDKTVTAGVTTVVTAGVTTPVTSITKLNDSSNDNPPNPLGGGAGDPPASPPDGGRADARDDASDAGVSSASPAPGTKGSRAQRVGGKASRSGKSGTARTKPESLRKRVKTAEPQPEPDLPEYDHGTAEGALIDAVLATPGRTARHVAGWLTPDGGFRFQVVRHPLNGAGVKGLYAVTPDMAGFRSAFTGALIHFGFREGAIVTTDYWARARDRLRREGQWRAAYEQIKAEELLMGFQHDGAQVKHG